MKWEIVAGTHTQAGRSQNEDAFFIRRGEPLFAALADGAGAANRAAKRALNFFEKLTVEATPAQVLEMQTWIKWAKLLDSSLLGGPQSTFLAVAISGNELVGICVGDSRGYLLNREGQCRIVNEGASKTRLGSGKIHPLTIRLTLNAGDTLLLLSDGAWTPFTPCLLQKTVVEAAVKHFSEVPGAILEAAGKNGRPDDQTVVCLRVK